MLLDFDQRIGLEALQQISEELIQMSQEITRGLEAHRVPLRVFADVMGLMFHSVCITDADRLIVYVNRAFLEISGYPEHECLNRNCSFLQGPETDQTVVLELREALDQGRAIKRVLLNYTKSGEKFYNHLHMLPVKDANGVVYAFLGMQHRLDAAGNIDISDYG